VKYRVNNPLCPKCGCGPRFSVGGFYVSTEASIVDGVLKLGKIRHVGKAIGSVVELECGGGHRWPVKLIEED
jgi:hypothetical protein